MKLLFTFLLCVALIFGFRQKPKDELVLIWPYSQHHQSVGTKKKFLTFKLSGDKLLIDTTYSLQATRFTAHHTETAADFPAISMFLSKPLTEIKYIESMIDEKACDNLTPCYIQCITTKVELIHFKRIDDCNSSHDGQLAGVYGELQVLQSKYTR